MSRAKLERRLEALEGQNGLDPDEPNAWNVVFEEVSSEALTDLGYIFEMEHPEKSPEWNISYSKPLGWDGPGWIASGPQAAHWYAHGWRCQVLLRLRPGRQEGGWPTYTRPTDELDGKIWAVLLADAPDPETFERWLTLLEIQ
jgi:hypothetical protein